MPDDIKLPDDIKSGSQLYRVYNDSRVGRSEHVIVKGIGPKWITIDGHRGERFHRDTLRSEGNRSRLYLSKEIHDAELARSAAWNELRRLVTTTYVPPEELSTDTILEAVALLTPARVPANG
ncbi:hypothetical protein G6L37_07075 [Agrobacterium rubi]|nr:hypothetical protein [Agrobacterium rubi]NTF25128.1 hypothetical protein [Agrobacterium rubi]